MRRIGFYITDFAGYEGFTVSDFDELVASGAVKIEGRDDELARGYLDAGDNADWTSRRSTSTSRTRPAGSGK